MFKTYFTKIKEWLKLELNDMEPSEIIQREIAKIKPVGTDTQDIKAKGGFKIPFADGND